MSGNEKKPSTLDDVVGVCEEFGMVKLREEEDTIVYGRPETDVPEKPVSTKGSSSTVSPVEDVLRGHGFKRVSEEDGSNRYSRSSDECDPSI